MFHSKAASTALFLLGFAGSALAHTKLEKSDPVDGAKLAAAPKILMLDFAHKTSLTMVKLTGGNIQAALSVDPTAPPTAHFSLPLPGLAVGIYNVRWTSLSPDDGHVMTGAISFGVLGK